MQSIPICHTAHPLAGPGPRTRANASKFPVNALESLDRGRPASAEITSLVGRTRCRTEHEEGAHSMALLLLLLAGVVSIVVYTSGANSMEEVFRRITVVVTIVVPLLSPLP